MRGALAFTRPASAVDRDVATACWNGTERLAEAMRRAGEDAGAPSLVDEPKSVEDERGRGEYWVTSGAVVVHVGWGDHHAVWQ